MSSRVKRRGHPARQMMSLAGSSDAALSEIIESTEWQFLPIDDRAFIMQYLIHGDYGKAMELTGVSHSWLEEREKDPEFKKILTRAMSMPAQVAVNMAKGATPESVEILLERMRDDSNKMAQLKAIEMVHKVAGIGVDEAGVQNNQWNITVTHWNTGKDNTPLEPMVGPGKVVDV